MLAGLLSDRVAVADAEVAGFGPPDPDDARWVADAVDKRRREFAAGRALARQALARLGVPAEACRLEPDEHGLPRWPAGLVGSITHAGGWCAAAVARAGEVRSLGIDGEDLARAPGRPDWLHLVLRPAERDALADLDPDAVGPRALLIFSAKESFYKCQFPLTRARLGFQDAEVVVRPDRGAFDLECAVPLPGLPRRWSGRFAVTERLVLTAVELPVGR
ncbi:MAG TPA: 4'-phosphopantetheinyl transferase superfamily protein [Kofleriaceae bacterium]|nr:4'-phosphopantetheinyl transferase superfamily protein [Kofleriaceae bacterium]